MIHDAGNHFLGLQNALAFDVGTMERLDHILAFDDAPGEMWMTIAKWPYRVDAHGNIAADRRKMTAIKTHFRDPNRIVILVRFAPTAEEGKST